MKGAVFAPIFAAASFLAAAPAVSFQGAPMVATDPGEARLQPVTCRAKARKHVAKKGRRYDWSYYPYWRPYQYRYWEFYYPHGGPLF